MKEKNDKKCDDANSEGGFQLLCLPPVPPVPPGGRRLGLVEY